MGQAVEAGEVIPLHCVGGPIHHAIFVPQVTIRLFCQPVCVVERNGPLCLVRHPDKLGVGKISAVSVQSLCARHESVSAPRMIGARRYGCKHNVSNGVQ